MPKRSGVSHAVAALVVLAVGPILESYVKLLVTAEDVSAVVTAAATTVAARPEVPFAFEAVSMGLSAVVVAVLAFVWGYAFHLKVVGR